MSETAENLEVPRRSAHQIASPEKSQIKERLNLHVKKRLQQEIDTPAACDYNAVSSVKKSRKPYQKRAGKAQSVSQTADTAGKKGRRHKLKRPGSTAADEQQQPHDGTADPLAAHSVVLAGDDGDGSLDGANDPDGRSPQCRDKEKLPDILGLVLSAKKRALIMDADVQEFLAKILVAIKN